MKNDIFINEIGERFRSIAYETKFLGLNKWSVVLEKIEEPKLEIGDWLKWFISSEDGIICPLREIKYGGDFPVNLYHKDLLEIRKANGEVWSKENEVWKRK